MANKDDSSAETLDFITTVLVPIFLSLVTFFGLIGNGIVILVIFLNKNLQTITNVYLLNLAIADFLLVANLPIWAITYRNSFHWRFSSFTCKFCRCILKQNLYASVGLLTALSVDRALAVVFAKSRARNITHGSTRSRRFKEKFTFPITCDFTSINITIVIVWISSFVLSLPEVIFSNTYFINNTTYCLFKLPINTTTAIGTKKYYTLMGIYELWIIIATFILPIIVLIICYSLIISTVKQKLIGNTEKKKRAIKLAVTVVVAFFLCFLPNHVIAIHSVLFQWFKIGNLSDAHVKLVHNLKSFAVCLAFFNSALNPLIYAFSVRNFQKSCVKLFKLEKYFDVTPDSSPSHAPMEKLSQKLKPRTCRSENNKSSRLKKYLPSLFHKKDTLEKSESMMDYNIDAILSERDHQLKNKNQFYKWNNHLPEGVRLSEVENSSASVMTQRTYCQTSFQSRGANSFIEQSSGLIDSGLISDRSVGIDASSGIEMDE